MQEHFCLLSCCTVYSRVPSRADSLKMLVACPLEQNVILFFFGEFTSTPKSCDSVKTGKEKIGFQILVTSFGGSPEPPNKFVKAPP